jgi:pimeloyl-ACP methyl ester carboxylesterase
MNSGIIAVGAARIAAEWQGRGQPVVLLHAGIADRRMWRHQFAALASRHHVIAFDRRGFGETPAVDEAYSAVADVIAVLDHLVEPGKPVVLVGCSQGGSIAIDAALAFPDRIAALILISPSVSGSPAATPHAAVRRLLDAIDAAGKSGDLGEVNRLKAALFLDGALAEEGRVKDPVRELFLAMNGIALAGQGIGRVVPPASAWGRLDRIAVPVRILCGDLDIPHIQARCRELATALPDARLEILPGVAHLPSLEQPDETSARLLDLLAEFQRA